MSVESVRPAVLMPDEQIPKISQAPFVEPSRDESKTSPAASENAAKDAWANECLDSIVQEAIIDTLQDVARSKHFGKLFRDKPSIQTADPQPPTPPILPNLDDLPDDGVERCQLCNKDWKKDQLIFPCICRHKKQLVHVCCLLESLTLSYVGYCRFCLYSFKFERKWKPLFEWTRNMEALIILLSVMVLMFIWIFAAFAVINIFWNNMQIVLYHTNFLTLNLFFFALFLGAYMHLYIIGFFAKRVRKYWNLWCESNIIWELKTYKGEQLQ